MIYFANASSPRIREAMRAGRVGMIATPAEGRDPADYPHWCADNGCFGRGYPGDAGWVEWLRSHAAHADRCWFATAPDVVGDAAATLARSVPWLPVIRQLGYPAALVAQNGLEEDAVPWESIDVLFLGGGLECPAHGYVAAPRTVGARAPGQRGGAHPRHYCPDCGLELAEWKLGAAAAALTAAAVARGKRVHMGRVNSRRRMQAAADMGCASCDGTFLAFGPERNLPQLLAWTVQPTLFG